MGNIFGTPDATPLINMEATGINMEATGINMEATGKIITYH